VYLFLLVSMLIGMLHGQARGQTLSSGYTATRYPIVLVHGLLGFGSRWGVDYFYRVPEALRKDGARVFVAELDAVNTSERRGEQLLAQVQHILALTGASKVNVIGHSQGAPTARYVAAVRPDLIASVTSVGGVNQGSAVADRLLGQGGADEVWRGAALRALAALSVQILDPRWLRTLNDLSGAGSARFNARYPAAVPTTPCATGSPEVNGVRYYSWSGRTPITHLLDPTDVPLALLAQAFDTPTDGLVSRCSSHLGQVIRDDYQMNHGDEINQVLGLVSVFEINPLSLYRQQANRLKLAGL
jgi:triacylglycerol lipase